MSDIEIEALLLKLEETVTTVQSQINLLHLDYVGKLQWKQLDELRNDELVEIANSLISIKDQLTLLENA